MGADIIGFINCPLQNSLGLDGFLHKLKLRAYRGTVEDMVPAHQRAEVKIEVQGTNNKPRMLTYQGILNELGSFENGIPECANCPISGGRQLGCYRFVKYPIDSLFEKLVFEFFVSQLPIKDSICDQIYQDVTSNVPLDSAWHTERGFQANSGGVAMLPKPLVHEWTDGNVRKRVDSAQILGSLFISLDRPALVVGYVRFWHSFIDFARPRVTSSPTLIEFLDIVPMYLSMLPIALQNQGIIYIDG